jgi:hypothetical protein
LFHQGDTKATISIADEIGKLAKLKEQGVITEVEFSQMKRNLMEGMKGPLNKVYAPFMDIIAQKENGGGVKT